MIRSARFLCALALAFAAPQAPPARANDNATVCRGGLKNDLDAVIAACTAAAAATPESSDDHIQFIVLRSLAHVLDDRYEDALADMTKVLNLRPTGPWAVRALLARAGLQRAAMKIDLALADVDEAMRLEPANPQALALRDKLQAAKRAEGCSVSSLAGDGWPKAGEVRRKASGSSCPPVTVTRAAIAAPGFVNDEVFVARRIERPMNKREKIERGHVFVGRRDGVAYGYVMRRSNAADRDAQIDAWIVRPPASSSGSDLMFPPWLEVTDALRSVMCSEARHYCIFGVRARMTAGVLNDSFKVSFDDQHPQGNLCIFIPVGDRDLPPARITVAADGKPVIENAVANTHVDFQPVEASVPEDVRAPYYCLGEKSAAMLQVFRTAAALSFRVKRAGGKESRGDASDLATDGIATGIDLARYLLTEAAARRRAFEALKPQADALVERGPQ